MQNNIEINRLNRRESESDFEISIMDVINFLRDYWKKLALAAFIGAILGFANWNFLSNYTSDYDDSLYCSRNLVVFKH